jgi:hypothetical protein
LVGQHAVLAQEQIRSVKTLPRNYHIRVKQFSEFIDRFNFQKDFMNNDIGPEFESIITRNDYILLLFNHEDKRLEPEVEDDTYQILVSMFIHEVCSDSIFIDRISENIFAELNCQINLNGKDQELNMLLKQEFDNGLKWSIIAVNHDFIRSYPYQQNKIYAGNNEDSPEIYIPPYSNETNFIDLKTLFNNHENLNSLSSEDCVKENLNGFYNLIRNGSLKYRHVKSIKYHVLDIPGWIMVVNNFQRDTDNSGWLISDLKLQDDNRNYFGENFSFYISGTLHKY